MKNGWLDSHAHIVSDELVNNFDEIKANAISNGVNKICIICGSLQEIERAMLLAENEELFDFAVGVHPSSVKDIKEAEFNKMMKFLDAPQVKFVGEIGLDYYWDTTFVEAQKEMFIRQITLANAHHLPIAIHMRESTDDVWEILKNNPVHNTGIAHCFTDGVESAQRFVDLGYYIGVGGILTFKNGTNVQALVQELPLERILTETDSPYLAPHPFRGRRNQPAYVAHVGEKIAEIKVMKPEEIQIIIRSNYDRLIKGGNGL